MSTPLAKYFAAPNIAKTYAFAERATGPPARALLMQAGLLSSLESTAPTGLKIVLDNACGPAILSKTFFDNKPVVTDIRIVCGDFSSGMVEAAKERIATGGWNAVAQIVDAQVSILFTSHTSSAQRPIAGH